MNVFTLADKGLSVKSDFRILAESSLFVLGHEFETVLLVDRRTGDRHAIREHYGDPCCGLIGPDDGWFVVGGAGLTYFDFQRGEQSFLRDPVLLFVHAIRLEASDRVRVLVDPWSDEASVWELDVGGSCMTKLHDGPNLRGEPFRELVPF